MSKKIEKSRNVTNNIGSNRTYRIGTYSLLCFVAAVMTIINIITDKGHLTLWTGIFAGLCLINILLEVSGRTSSSIAKFLFAIEVIALFTFFIISGNPEGFSTIWICLMPSIGMIFFNRRNGSILSIVMLVILIFLLWIPQGKYLLQFQYTETFMLRFPILYLAFFLMGYLMETLRVNAYKETVRLQEYYHDLSIRDQLTRVYNRQGMYSALKEDKDYCYSNSIYVAMFDIDDFKSINDKYGHVEGDVVLKTVTEIISNGLNAMICRWGGEEFIAVFSDGTFDLQALENVRKKIEGHQFENEIQKYGVTVSIGVCGKKDFKIEEIDALANKADEALYEAKRSGKNKVVCKSLDD